MKIDPKRRKSAKEIAALLEPGIKVALTTHVNADGDGAGSEVAIWHLLKEQGIRAVIANPTPFPERYRFLLDGLAGVDKSRQAQKYCERADVIFVMDISDLDRLGHLSKAVADAGVPVACIDHHETDGSLPEGPRLIDAGACSTGELVYDLAKASGWSFGREAARAAYVAILADTGGFRFSNTTPRALKVAAELLDNDVDPGHIYELVYSSSPEARVRLLAEVLETLVVERDSGIAWVTVPSGALERWGAGSDDLEGVVEFPRSIHGVRLALLFREIANGRIKVSFRSLGDVNVAALAEEFGGGGHAKASGASLEGTMGEVQDTVLSRAREYLAVPS